MNIVIGITGIFGSGKTTVSSILKKNKVPVISSDEIVHKILKKKIVKNNIREKFGDETINSRGAINIKKLSDIVFSKKERKEEIEKLIHPLVFQEIKKKILDFKKKECKITVVEIPLLFETKSEKYFDKILVVYTSPEVIKKRLKGKYSEEEVEKRWQFQISQEIKKTKADFVIDNSGRYSHTKHQVEKLLKILD